MAEFVQHEIERTIQDLEVLEKYGIFEKDEIRAVIKKRRDFEYRVRKVKKTKDDFLRYIAYEENLLKLIRIRKEKQGLTTDKTLLEKPVLDHIRKLFEICLLKFQSDISIWLSYIDFSMSQKAYPHVTNVYFKMLQFHNRDFLWIKFAKFELEIRNSTESARKIFLKAITFHSESKALWIEYFRFEMLYCTKIRRRFSILSGHEDEDSQKKKSRDAIWNGELALIVFGHAVKNHPNFEFARNFLEVAGKFDAELAITVKEKLVDEIRGIFGETESFWNLMAEEEIDRYEIAVKHSEKSSDEQVDMKKIALKRAMDIHEKSCTVFDNQKAWGFYLRFRFQMILEHNISDKESIAEVLFTCERLWSESKVNIEVFKQWVQLYGTLYGNNAMSMKKLHNYCVEASERWPKDLDLHLFIACLFVKLNKVKVSDVEEFFDESLTQKFVRVKDYKDAEDEERIVDSLIDFWELYLHFMLSNQSSERSLNRAIEKLFKIGSFLPRKFSAHFKVFILELFFKVLGIEKTRIFFNERKNLSPVSKDFFVKMLEIEKTVIDSNSDENILSIYRDLVHHFGTSEPEIWLEYVQFAIKNRRVPLVGQIYDNAIKTLNSNVVGRFVQGYALVNIQ